ncbi:MAG TPA: YoaK family protein [Solirubrobacteraceae bacterium]|nr:YoaK family protein [Solirubrobacteraceae bacterium]
MAGTASRPAAGALWKRDSRIPQVLLALALGAGFLDAASYLGFGHVFPANMTGNTVLLAVAAIRGNPTHAARSVTALAGFAGGVALGAAIVRRRGRWPRRAAGIFWLECVLLAALLFLWGVAGTAAARYWLIALASAAMGGQSVAVRASHVSGVQTTYMTSTYQSAVARLIFRLRGIREENAGPALPGSAWITYGVGALIGALAESGWGVSSVAVPLAIVAAVAISAIRNRSGVGMS